MSTAPFALVVGDVSLVRALGRMHVPVVVATNDALAPAARSRFCRGVVRTPSFVDDPDGAVDAVVAWARAQPLRPVVFYQGTADLLAFSRRRARLEPHAHIVLPPADLVEDLVDEVRFAALAEELELPLPETFILRRDGVDALPMWDAFPCVIKRTPRAHQASTVVHIADRASLEAVAYAALADGDCVVQAAVAGGDDRVLSYHAYVRDDGTIAAEFTGKKVRAQKRRGPASSTCLRVAHEPDVLFRGREVVEALGFHGVLKMDFKRDARDEQLYLLRVHPRFNLWHHAATLAGVAVPALVYEDCVHPIAGALTVRPKRDVVWMRTREDMRAAFDEMRAGALSLSRWLADIVHADVREDFCFDDPLPLVFDVAQRARDAFARRNDNGDDDGRDDAIDDALAAFANLGSAT